MIFEIGNEDPVIYTEEEILKEAKKFLTENECGNDYQLIQDWTHRFKAIIICDNNCKIEKVRYE